MTFRLARILPSLPGLNSISVIDHFPLIGSQLDTDLCSRGGQKNHCFCHLEHFRSIEKVHNSITYSYLDHQAWNFSGWYFLNVLSGGHENMINYKFEKEGSRTSRMFCCLTRKLIQKKFWLTWKEFRSMKMLMRISRMPSNNLSSFLMSAFELSSFLPS